MVSFFFGSKALDEQREQERSLGEMLERGRLRTLELNEELGMVVRELQNARIDSQENRRQRRRDEIFESLRRLYPDVVVLHHHELACLNETYFNGLICFGLTIRRPAMQNTV